MLVTVLNTSTTPLCLLCVVCLPISILHIQHPSPHPLTVPIQPRQAASCKEPCETHGARAELGHSFICFSLGISQPYCSRGLTSPGADGAARDQDSIRDEAPADRGTHSWHSHPVCLMPWAVQVLSRVWAGHESKGKKNKLVHPPLGSERAWRGGSSCLFKVQTSAVNLLPVCISLEPLSVGGAEMGSPLCAGAGSGYWKWR